MKFVPNAVSRAATRQVLAAKQNSPAILFGAGIVGFIGTAVLASKATLKLDETLEEYEKKSYQANLLREEGRIDYTENDYRSDMVVLYTQTAVKVTKLYAPAIILGSISIACLTKSHNIMAERNSALAAAYVAVDRAFKGYRERVTEEIGEERERELYHDVRSEEVTTFNAKGERKGREQIKSANGGSPYARLFSKQTSSLYERDQHYNLAFLKLQEEVLTQELARKGILLLNDVFDALGLDRTEAGGIVGWIYGEGDSYVNLGVFRDQNKEAFFDYMSGREDCIWLDFNVDGPVLERYSKIKLRRK